VDSAGRIGLSISPNGVLIVVVGGLAVEEKNGKNRKNRNRLGPWHYNQQRYMNYEGTNGFSVSNRFIYTPKRRSNCSRGWFGSGGKTSKVGKTGADFCDSATISKDMGIRRTPMDSTCRIGPFISHTAF
jgi:hypothetical protein